MDEAIAAGVLHNVGDRLAFRHALIRQVLQEQTPPAVRGGLRQQIAWQLAKAGAGMEVVGRHSGDPLATGYARHALTLLHDSPSAVEHIEAALADLPDDPDSQDLRLMLLNNKRRSGAACHADAEADPVPARLLAARCCQAMLDGDARALLAVAEEVAGHVADPR